MECVEERYTDKQDKERMSLCKVGIENFSGGCARFEKMTVSTLKKLINKGYIDLEDCQNDSPTVKEYLEFMEKHPRFRAHGYIVSNDRDDRRITIEGLEAGKTTLVEMFDFIDFERYADEFEVSRDYCRSWWD